MSCNPACVRIFGLADSALSHSALPRFGEMIGESPDLAGARIAQAISRNESVGQDVKLAARAGKPTRWVNVVLSPIEDRRLQGVVNDITDRKRSEDSAQELAVTDSLTGLANRLGFERRLEQMIDAYYRDPGARFAMLMVDLDYFKAVNDTFGHAAGDEVLVRVAKVLEGGVRKTDFVGRLGGDEFVVLLDSTSRRELIEPIIRKIIAGIGRPIPIGEGNTARIGASVGAAVFEGDSMTRDELIREADKAMYHAKESGRNTFRFFEQSALA